MTTATKTDQVYLEEVLEGQDLGDDSEEMKDLRAYRKDVEGLLTEKFSSSSPTIRYGGSKAKGTLIKEYYDLDIVCYFPHDETDAGETLEEIYNNVRDALKEKYDVREKTSALRLRSKDGASFGKDFHIDVVPGRYIDEDGGDCFLHQTQGDKTRRKTNLQTHIDYIKNSGVVDAIRVLKLWKVRRGLTVKQFVFELLIIKLLKGKKSLPLPEQVEHVWKELAEASEPIPVEDPANPSGNDLMSALKGGTWTNLTTTAASTLETLESSGWEAIFGAVEKTTNAATRIAGLSAAAYSVSRPTKPFGYDE